MRGMLEGLRLPEGKFAPQGEWEHHYAVCVLGPARQAAGEHAAPYGYLTLRRKAGAGAGFALNVDISTAARGGAGGLHTRASIACANDVLATPQAWELSAEIIEGGKPEAGTAVRETGALHGGVLVRRGRVERSIPMRRPFTSNWSLLDAVQRLPFDGTAPLEFDMFEDLDLHKPGQRLASIGSVSLPMKGRTVRLHGFRQIGRGILPYHYWLDDDHRLIAAAGSLRGFIWDAAAQGKDGE